MAPVPTPPVNVPDLSEEEAARTPNGYPNYYDKIAKEEQDLRDKVEGDATVKDDEPVVGSDGSVQSPQPGADEDGFGGDAPEPFDLTK